MSIKRTDLLNREQAAEYLGMSKSWLAQTKDGPVATRIGTRPMYLLADLDAYIEARRGTPKPPQHTIQEAVECPSTNEKAPRFTGAGSMSRVNRSESQRVKQIASELRQRNAESASKKKPSPVPPPPTEESP